MTAQPREDGYRYPMKTRLHTSLSLLVYVWFFLTGVYFLVAAPSRDAQAWFGMAVFVALFGIGGLFLARRQLQLMSVIYVADDGLHVRRLNDEVITIRWVEITEIRDRSRWGDFDVRCNGTDKRLRVNRRLIGLDDLRSKIVSSIAKHRPDPRTT